MASELGQQTVEFSTLVNRTAEESFLSLKELVEKSKAAPDQSDTDKKIGLLKYLAKTQQRMLRLNVLAKWCQQVSSFYSLTHPSIMGFLFGVQLGVEIIHFGPSFMNSALNNVTLGLFLFGLYEFGFFKGS